MNSEAELLRAIYDEVTSMSNELKKLEGRIGHIELSLIQEDTTEDDITELDRLAEQTRKDGIEWSTLKSELNP